MCGRTVRVWSFTLCGYILKRFFIGTHILHRSYDDAWMCDTPAPWQNYTWIGSFAQGCRRTWYNGKPRWRPLDNSDNTNNTNNTINKKYDTSGIGIRQMSERLEDSDDNDKEPKRCQMHVLWAEFSDFFFFFVFLFYTNNALLYIQVIFYIIHDRTVR